MNKDILKGKWKDLRGKARQKWGRLTDDDVEYVGGSLERLVGKLQERYSMKKDEAQKMIESWMDESDSKES